MKVIIAALTLVVASQALILCPDNACDKMVCDDLLTAKSCAANGGNVKAKAGFCGCCDLCVQTLKEGEDCRATMLLGVPATAECDKDADLHCDTTTGQCAKKNCAVKKQELDNLVAAMPRPLPGLFIPVCAADGSYAGKQCSGSQCYCVDTEGKAIPSYSDYRWKFDDKVTCQCARDLSAYMATGLIGRLFHCTPMGDYEPVQCHGSVCYCADRSTGKQLEGMSGVHISNKDSLKC
ncbi:equistatin-like [Watersipora subatra]|uniref:equistatin-like n=1 Tax=Watersipora subatra TaxID=2589382 RepID=UPI00355BFCEB